MTNEEIAAMNDALENQTWTRMDRDRFEENEDRLCMDADSYNDAQGFSVEFEEPYDSDHYDEPYGEDAYYEPDFEDDESAMTSAGMGEDESYGYIEDMGFYEYEN